MPAQRRHFYFDGRGPLGAGRIGIYLYWWAKARGWRPDGAVLTRTS